MMAVVTGMIATYPVGGVLWDYGQYAAGLERLGFEVYYLEDTGGPAYDPQKGSYEEGCEFGVDFLGRSLEKLSPSLAGRWHFRDMDGGGHGMTIAEMDEVAAEADLFLNVSGGCLLRDSYMRSRRKVLIDTDPGWNQFVNYPRWDAHPGWLGTHGYRSHDHFFSYAERLGKSDCLIPAMDLHWQPTRPPVLVSQWQAEQPGETWTTVMTWNNFRKPIEYQGAVYGTKELEFGRIEELPTLVTTPLEVAVGGLDAPRSRWRDKGWSVVDSHSVSTTAEDYRSYIQRSRGELSVAKNVYVATRTGWFSCRSVCYLAAGLPVVVQDTGFSELYPTGQGLLAFSSTDEAQRALETVESDYSGHAEAARALALKEFDSDKVLGNLLERAGLG